MELFNLSKKKSVQLAFQNCLSEADQHVLTLTKIEEEAVLSANLKRKLWNVYTNFLLMILMNAVQCYCEVSRNQEQ